MANPHDTASRGRHLGLVVALATALGAAVVGATPAAAQPCTTGGMVLQVLGTSGPRATPNRASSSYLVWIDGRPRILVDAGGGSYFRFGQSTASVEDLQLVALTHFHPDHVSDLPAVLWSDNTRQAPLRMSGPSGSRDVPSLSEFVGRLFGPGRGAFTVLDGVMGGPSKRGVPLDLREVDISTAAVATVLELPGLVVRARRIPHGDIPALAYRIETASGVLVLSTDQNGSDPTFAEFAAGADVLVMHLAIAPGAKSPLHAAPDDVGRLAGAARARELVVSHLGPFDIEPAVRAVAARFPGMVSVASDLQCIPVRRTP